MDCGIVVLMDCGIVSLAQLIGAGGYRTFRTKFPNASLNEGALLEAMKEN